MVIRPERKLIFDAFKEVLIYNGVSKIEIEELKPVNTDAAEAPQVSFSINKKNDI